MFSIYDARFQYCKLLVSPFTKLSLVLPLNPFPNDKFETRPNDNFKCDKNGRKFFKRLENTVEKGKIARHEQFLLFSQCFLKTCTADT